LYPLKKAWGGNIPRIGQRIPMRTQRDEAGKVVLHGKRGPANAVLHLSLSQKLKRKKWQHHVAVHTSEEERDFKGQAAGTAP